MNLYAPQPHELVNRPIWVSTVFPVEINPVCNLLHKRSTNGQGVPPLWPSVQLPSMKSSEAYSRQARMMNMHSADSNRQVSQLLVECRLQHSFP